MKIEAPIQKVRLLEDRALITRQTEFEIEPGSHTVYLENVSPILADKTLTARLSCESPVTLTECRIVRRQRSDSEQSNQELQDLAKRVQEVADAAEFLNDRLRNWEALESSSCEILAHWLNQTGTDVHWGRGDAQTWELQLKAFTEKQQVAQRERLQIQSELEETSKQHRHLAQQLAEKQTPSENIEASLLLALDSQEASTVRLEIEYVVPSACWRPAYSARWQDENLEMMSQACVWQNTGEDWHEVELTFSTQRATLGTSPPILSRDILRLQKKQKQVLIQTREESVIVKHKKAAQVPGIDDGGEVLSLLAPAKATVLSDGRPYRIPLFSFSSQTQQERLVLAELAECVVSNSLQKNTSKHPLLPGPVELIKSGGLVGRTYLEHTSPAQEFRLNWGAVPAVSVHREHLTGKQEQSVVSSWKTVSHTVKLHLRNQTQETQEFLVRERIPVSELKEVKVVEHPKKTTEKRTADSNGFVEWQIRLEPYQQKSLELHYDLQKKKKVVDGS